MTEASTPRTTVLLFVAVAAVALGTLAAAASKGDVLRAVVAGAAMALSLVAALLYERRLRKAAVVAGAALGVQVLSLTLAFGGASILAVVANVAGSVAALLAIVGRLVELPEDWHRAHA